MKKQPKDSAIGRREFLAATSGLLAAAVPGVKYSPMRQIPRLRF